MNMLNNMMNKILEKAHNTHAYRITFRRLIVLWGVVFLSFSPMDAYSSERTIKHFAPVPSVEADAYVLVDAETGVVLAEKKSRQQYFPASLTKLMTSFIVAQFIENGVISLNDEVKISENAWRMGGSRMFIEAGSKVTVDQLLKGLIIQSGNDASIALAELVAGSEGAFVDLMNQFALELHMTDSHFKNASGWPDKAQVVSAYDISLLARTLVKRFPEHYKLYSQKNFTYNGIKQSNRNLLLWQASDIDGMKTGYSESSGYNMVASANRRGMRLIAVVLGAESEKARANQSMVLLNYGYRYFINKTLYAKNEPIYRTKVWSGNQSQIKLGSTVPVNVVLSKGFEDDIQSKINMEKTIIAPIKMGQVLGSIDVLVQDEKISSFPLVALEEIEQGNLLKRFYHRILLLIKGLWFLIFRG